MLWSQKNRVLDMHDCVHQWLNEYVHLPLTAFHGVSGLYPSPHIFLSPSATFLAT